MNPRVSIVLLAALASFAGGVLSSAAQPWTHDPQSPIGPGRWGEIAPAFRTCGSTIEGLSGFQETDTRQSPIDLVTSMRARLPWLLFWYGETAFDVENTGHVVEVPYEPGSMLRVGGEVFELQQFHFHAPSEHTVGGRSFPMELHLVHADALGSLAVVGVLLQVGASPSLLIDEIFAHAPIDEGSTHVGGTVDATELLPRSLGYSTYEGSLTTPPCSEGVRWFVLKRPVQVSEETVAAFRELIGAFPEHDGFSRNNRPVRPRNGRVVLERR